MKVLVTGASGFIGSHTVRALAEAGFEVRAVARSIERIRQALSPLGCVDAVEMVTADLTTAAPVRDALTGCDALVHAAAVYSHDARRRREMLTANPRCTELVLNQACEFGLDPIVHVSSYAALLPAVGPLTVDSPVGEPPVPYARSKAHSDEIARRWQADRAPVSIIYPGMVWGPYDPVGGESAQLARAILRGAIPFGIPGAVPVVDVRDVAQVITAALRAEAPYRSLAVAQTITMHQLQRRIAELAGRRTPERVIPAPLLLAMGRFTDLVQRVLPVRLPVNYEGPWTALHCPPIDAAATSPELGVTFRPFDETLHDTVRWLAG